MAQWSLGQALLESGDLAGAAAALERLAALAREANDDANEAFALRVVADVYPYDVDTHVQLGRRALARKDYAEALTELQAVVALGPLNKAEALKALEQAPTYARAQDILLAVIRKP